MTTLPARPGQSGQALPAGPPSTAIALGHQGNPL